MPDRGALLDDGVAVEELTLAEPGPGEVLVRITATGVCHSDLHVIQTGGWGMPLPVLLGHEGAGVIEAVGEGVDALEPGDGVVLAWRSPCGACEACRRGDPRRCLTPLHAKRRLARARDGARITQALLLGTFATRTIVHAGQAIKVPAELPPEQACLLGCAVATGVGSVLNTSPPWAGASVAVIGCGAVGLSVVQGARIAGAARIVAVDPEPRKLAWARELGATETTLDATEVTDVDFAYEAVGRPQPVEQAVRMLAHGGTATLIGVPKPGQRVGFDLERELFAKRATIRVSYGGDQLPADDFPKLAQLALAGELDLARMVTRTAGLDDVRQAFADMQAGEVVRTVLRP